MSQSADVSFIGEDDSEYFRRLFDRTFNNLNTRYLLPADEDEVKELAHIQGVQIRDYPQFLREITRLLRPGGLVLLIEPDLIPIVDGRPVARAPANLAAGEWSTFWETYRGCLTRQDIDVTVPQRLTDMLTATGAFENIVKRDGNIPVGFWPKGWCP
ncbi:hypothetical protein HHX47_DHR1000588 [Lentinula edodes]|nr:hypothetical protein HHX47_DHR1000588 [Lentinula edodes]